MEPETSRQRSFEAFLGEFEAGLRHALIGLFGPEAGRDAAAEALLYAWEHWDRVGEMDNPGGYLFRVGQSWGRRDGKQRFVLPAVPEHREPWVEPALPAALGELSGKQRVAVMLRHGSDWDYDEIGRFMGITEAAARKNVQRGLAQLRDALEVPVES